MKSHGPLRKYIGVSNFRGCVCGCVLTFGSLLLHVLLSGHQMGTIIRNRRAKCSTVLLNERF